MYLDGIRVLDFSRVLAGPLATQILADFGAEVLKIEPPAGDDTRTWGPPFQGTMSAYFQSANRGKSSLVLDLKADRDRQRARELIAIADIVVDNYLPSTRQRLGLAHGPLLETRPDLIAASVVGYHGRRADDPGYDLILQAESGFLGITGPAEGAPHKVGVAVIDVLTGMMAANGILAALVRRLRTGRGASLSISLFQTALFSLINVATNHLVTGDPTPRWGNDHPNLVPYGVFQTADEPIAVGVGNDPQYHRLLGRLGLEGSAIADLDNAGRLARRTEVVETIGSALRRHPSHRVLAALQSERIPCGPVLRPDQALAKAATWSPDALLAVPHEELGTVRLPASPIVGDGMRAMATAPPNLGEGGEALATSWLTVDAAGSAQPPRT